MVNCVIYQIALYCIGSLAINIIVDLLKTNDPEIIEVIEKFGTELQEILNNRIPEEVEVEVEECTSND